jgi:signal transduction histidine kinase/DNA-binding response OmpR family regulator
MVETSAIQPNILVVDDENNVLSTLQAVLQGEGYHVEAADGGAAALDAIRERHYDLVLTDLKMPGIDGLALLAEVRKRSPETVTIMMTGYGALDTALEAIQLGAYEYLLKPMEIPELKLAVKRSLEKKRFSEIETLYSLSRVISESADSAAISSKVCEAACQVFNLKHASLAIMDSKGNARNCDPTLLQLLDDAGIRQRLGQGETICAEKGGISVKDWAGRSGIGSFILVPGIGKERLACVLLAHNGTEPHDFHASEQRFLRAMTNQAALALENFTLVEELKTNNQELAAANHKLKELDSLKSQFLSVATHELRTPLTILLGYNSMLQESLEDRLTAPERQTLDESISACKRLIRLVNSMLDLSQIQAGKMKMEFVHADLRSLVNGVVAQFQPEARSRGMSLGVNLPARLPKIWVDADRLQQVLINLLGNAMKFTTDGGAIRVHVRHQLEQEAVEIAVIDNGGGISEEDQHEIFNEFAQVRRQVFNRQRHGSGLGLAIARRIVEAHGGTLEVSSHMGVGSTFMVSLPLKAGELKEAASA